MRIGIVGAEGAKFTDLGIQRAKQAIDEILTAASCKFDGPDNISVVSGECYLGGIDIWAKEIATKKWKIGYQGFPSAKLNWAEGYKPRNLQIARNSDKVICIAVDKLPPDFKGMTFKGCYHCAKYWPEAPPHVKGGGCWTMHQAGKMGKEWELIVVNNE